MSTNTDSESSSDTTESGSSDTGGDSGPGTREVAYRLFATEFDDADLSYSESDEERAPNYVVTPTGLRVNRLFAVGVLTEVERLNTDTLRGRIVDPTGAFVTYAGQYQPEAQAFLDSAASPSFVAITGKARTFEPEDSDQIFTSVRPESLSEVTADTRDRWTVSAAEATLDRIAIFAEALDSGLAGDDLQAALADAGVDTSLAAGIPRAIEHYGTTTAYLEAIRQCAVDALEVVADERDEVRPVSVAPGEGGEATLGPLPVVEIDISSGEADDVTADADASPATAETETPDAETPDAETSGATTQSSTADADAQSTAATDTAPDTGSTTETAAETKPETTDETPSVDAGIGESDSASATTDDEETAAEPTASEPPTATADAEAPTAGERTESPVPDDTGSEGEADNSTGEDADADEPEMYQLDEDEREELESEYGADFSSGNEVDPAGEADIDVPDADELAAEVEDDAAADAGATASDSPPGESPAAEAPTTESTDSTESLGSFEDTVDSSDDTGDESAGDAGTASETTEEPTENESEPAGDVNLEDAAVELMSDLDDGDGADREAVVAAVVEEHGVDSAAVEDAIADALMGGRCYEPDDGILKPI